MGITSQSTVATGDTIEAAYSNTNRDNVAVLDVRTGGDPGAADKWLVSSGALGAAWVARLTAVLAAIGYTPANIAGDTFTGHVVLNNAVFLRGKNTGGTARTLIVIAGDNTVYVGDTNQQLNLQSSAGIQVNGSGNVWTSDNDGPSSGLAAQTAASATTASTASAIADGAVSSAAKIADAIITLAKMAASATDQAAGTASLRTLGTGAAQAAAGDHIHSGGDAGTLDGIDSTGFLRLSSAGGTQTFTGPASTSIIFGGFTSPSGVGMKVNGDFHATGTKTRVATGHDGSPGGLLHALETPLPMFEEPGRAQIVDGVAVVPIPPDFANYVDLTDYYVFLTPEGPGRLYVDLDEMTPESFTVRALDGDPDVSFVWLLMARQGDMGHIERVLPLGEPPEEILDA